MHDVTTKLARRHTPHRRIARAAHFCSVRRSFTLEAAMPEDIDIPAEYASPACLMHEIDPVYAGLDQAPAPPPEGVAAWRKARREDLIAARLAIPAETRTAHSHAIGEALDKLIGD